MAEVAGLADEPLLLPSRAPRLRVERVLERERLAAEGHLVVVVRERSVDRIAEQDDQACLGDRLPHPSRRERVEQVAGARLADGAPGRPERKLAAVPPAPPGVVSKKLTSFQAGPVIPGCQRRYA